MKLVASLTVIEILELIIVVSFVYVRYNTITGKAYIGKANNPERRWAEENSLKTLKQGGNSPVERAIAKYGADAFINYIVAEFDTEDEAYDYEKELTIIFNAVESDMFYNIKEGGKGGQGGRKRPEHSKRMSGKGNPMYGNGHKITGEKNGNYGVKMTDERKKHQSEMMKGRHDGDKNPNYGNSKVDEAGGIDFLKAQKAAGKMLKDVAIEIGYPDSTGIVRYLKRRGTSWRKL